MIPQDSANPKDTDQKTVHEQSVKSAMEIALERAAMMEDEPIDIETEEGSVSMTFEELKSKAAKSEEYLDQLRYKQAEFDNYRKRTIREKEEYLKENVPVLDLFEILDHLDRALASAGDAESIRQGVALIRGQFWNLLERKGLEPLPGQGEPFDPNLHEAIASQPDATVPEGCISLVYQPGYRIGERVIRPSKVVVSAGPGGAAC